MPSAETEHYLKEAGRVRNQANSRGRLLQPARRYLRPNEKHRREDEAKRLRDMLSPQNIMASKMGEQSVAQARHHLNVIEEDLEENSPPTDIPGETKDVLQHEFERELSIYREGWLTHEEMRRNQAGAVDRNLKHAARVVDGMSNKSRHLKMQNLLLLINSDSDEQDLCNLEKYRGHSIMPNGASIFQADAQIPGVFGMTAQAKENWPENMPEFGTANSPLKQADDRERELEARIRELEAELKQQKMSARTQKQLKRAESSLRMKEYWRKKREQAATAPIKEGD